MWLEWREQNCTYSYTLNLGARHQIVIDREMIMISISILWVVDLNWNSVSWSLSLCNLFMKIDTYCNIGNYRAWFQSNQATIMVGLFVLNTFTFTYLVTFTRKYVTQCGYFVPFIPATCEWNINDNICQLTISLTAENPHPIPSY